ncbi:MAG: DUF4957 domain-containing protein [Prevotella sp.]|nr:DUF4957 domain-containing protein [Prevotella sp.]
MKKLTNNICTTLGVLGVLLLGSCADGYESPDGFDLGVKNSKMETPIQDSISFKVSTDGKTATVSWPTVAGADGHEVTFMNVDDPNNPVIIDGYDKKIVDGSKFTIPVTEDSKYKMLMRTLGNKELGNTDADSARTFNFSTLVPSVMTIPSGEEISSYIAAHPLDSVTEEVAIDLEPNGVYSLNEGVDFAYHKLTFRGDKIHRPIVNITGDGHFETYATLKVKYINFDMSESTAEGFIAMSKTAPDSIKVENLWPYNISDKNPKLSKGHYMVEDPIYIANCWFKNLPHAMLYDNELNCAFWYFTVSNCIVQMRNETKSNVGFINLYKAGKAIKNIVIEKSTIYNTVDNGSACFIRYQHPSNAQPNKTFGSYSAEYQSQSWTFSQTTFSKTYTGWRFVNNTSGSDFTLNVDHCIFYDVAQLYRMDMGSKTYRFNFLWSPREDDIKRNNNMSDSGKAPFASVYDPQFKGDVTQELDFSLPNGGVDFTPQEYEIVVNRGGDPRWLPASSGSEEE